MSKLAVALETLLLSCILCFSCGRKAPQEAIKFQQYYAQGELIYGVRCSNCHQKSGQGLGLVYPPVNISDYLDKHQADVICLIKYGRKGAILVNGKSFNQPMPGVPTLTDLEIAELTTYLYNTWERKTGIVDVEDVSKTIERCAQ
jgi:cytochrome c551